MLILKIKIVELEEIFCNGGIFNEWLERQCVGLEALVDELCDGNIFTYLLLIKLIWPQVFRMLLSFSLLHDKYYFLNHF